MSQVYMCFCTVVIHKGHLNIINEARKLGDVTASGRRETSARCC